MSKYYEDFIGLRPGYESVVKIESDKDKNYWKSYIVNEEMVEAVRVLIKSLKRADVQNDTWHFIMQGTYGTGKTYSALVIKHLLEDDLEVIEPFLKKNQLFVDVRDAFLGIRKAGKYVVSWKSGESKRLNTTNKFLLELERTIKESLLREGYTNLGCYSLIDSIKAKVQDNKATLRQNFDDDEYSEFFASYSSFDEFERKIDAGDRAACDIASELFSKKDIYLATDLPTFKNWLIEIFKNNPALQKTGIFIIWDEFSDYIRSDNDLQILQELSEFSQTVPFYILYVIHTYSANEPISNIGNMKKVEQRFHKISISLTEATTLKLIGESIIPHVGLEHRWEEISAELFNSIKAKAGDFLHDDLLNARITDIKNQFPIHPMTVNLMATIAGKFSGSSRSVFRFLKDEDVEEQETGFRHFIKNNGPDGWKWITIDYLWDYFFVKKTKDSDSLNLSKEAKQCLSHYGRCIDRITNENQRRIFKAALLLKATVETGEALRKQAYGGKKVIKATLNTMIDCFFGQLDREDIERYLQVLNSEKILLLTPEKGDLRIGLPLSVDAEEFEVEFENIKKNNSPHILLDSVGDSFGKALKTMILTGNKPIAKRLEFETCWGSTQSINIKKKKLYETINKYPHVFGVLLVAIGDVNDVYKIEPVINEINEEDDTDRLIIVVIRTPLSEENRDYWYEYKTRASLALKAGNAQSNRNSNEDAVDLVNGWVQSAVGKNMSLYYKNSTSFIANNAHLLNDIERIVFSVFPYAPETIVRLHTVYRSGGSSAAELAIKKIDNSDDDKAYNRRIETIVEILKEEKLWEKNFPEQFSIEQGSKVELSVGNLVQFISKKLESNSLIMLDELWEELQSRLFGYYDTLVCYYLLGFAMQFYVDKGYSWFDGTDSHSLNAKTLATMIGTMCKGKAIGHRLSIGTEVERQFYRLAREIFGLSDSETGDIELTRKHLREKIIEIGYPLWIMKYLDVGKDQVDITQIIEKYQSFIVDDGDQKAVVEDIVQLLKGNERRVYRSVIAELVSDKGALREAMNKFILVNSPEISEACQQYGFTEADVFNMLNKHLQQEIWQQREHEVMNRLPLLLVDIQLIGIINGLFETENKTIEKTREILINIFKHMKIPGNIYEDMNQPWSKTVKNLYEISENKWVSYSVGKKQTVIKDLLENVTEAWHHIKEPTEILGKYANKYDYKLNDDELKNVLFVLNDVHYEYKESIFRENLRTVYNELEYSKKVKKLGQIWEKISKTKSVTEWCNQNCLPIVWLIPELSETIQTLKQLEKNEKIDLIRLDNAINQLLQVDYSILLDKNVINRCLINNIASDEYYDYLIPHLEAIVSYLKRNIVYNVYDWTIHSSDLRKATKQFIQTHFPTKLANEAKQKLSNLTEKELRERFLKVLDKYPDICLMILKD